MKLNLNNQIKNYLRKNTIRPSAKVEKRNLKE